MPNSHAHCILRQVRSILATHDTDHMTDCELLRRFAQQHDQAAFTSIVRRHGLMVLGVCRRVLPNPHDADDAFQAAFFTLAREAGCRTWHHSIASWLHLVAHRLALKIKAAAKRRARHESRATARAPDDALSNVTGRELCSVLDAELRSLPERLRAPLVLCCMEGQTRDEAARCLGLSVTTLKRRLEQGRDRLRTRLQRRGFALPATFVALMAVEGMQAALPLALVQQVVAAASAGVPASARVTALSQSILQSALRTKGKALASLLALGVVMSIGAGIALSPWTAESPPYKAASASRGQPQPTAESRQTKADRHGDPLPPGALARLGTTRWRHSSFAGGSSVWFAEDGKSLLSANHLGEVVQWDAATGRKVRRILPEDPEILKNPDRFVPCIALSKDGRTVAFGGRDGSIRLIDVARGQLRQRCEGHDGLVNSVALSGDGQVLISRGNDLTVRTWDATTGKEVKRQG
jgi:RNA polymerase sigma factor (sigma-70 family)